ncbi:MAG: PKD domain-containing protein, partial [Verrucomicrobia bacterium]|nr:PKD domain-containing protein [Verrucomicrobiota bacterium]
MKRLWGSIVGLILVLSVPVTLLLVQGKHAVSAAGVAGGAVSQGPARVQPAVPGVTPRPGRASAALPATRLTPARERRAFDAFTDWTHAYLAAPPAEQARLEAEGIVRARVRRQSLAALIQTDPQRALELAVPWSVRQRLPPSVTGLLEEPVSGRGDFQVFAAVPMPGQLDPVSPITRFVTLGRQTYQAYVYGRRRQELTRSRVPLHGIALGSALAVAEEPGRVVEPAEAAALRAAGATDGGDTCAVCGLASTRLGQQTWLEYAGSLYRFCRPSHAALFNRRLGSAADVPVLPDSGVISTNFGPVVSSQSQGPKTLLFMRVRFPDDPTEPITESAAYALMNDVNRYFVEASYHTTAILSTVTPLLMLPQVKLWYGTNGPGALQADARAAARSAGFDYATFDLDIVRHVSVPGYKWGGLAAVGGRGVWLQADGLGVAAHELGHNFGLFHANFWNTVRPPLTGVYPDNPGNLPFDSDSLIGHDSVIGPGLDSEYGDSFDIMGGGGGHYNVIAKHRLNWLPDPFLQAVTQSGTNRLYAFDVPALVSGRIYALKIKKDFERNYWAEFRSQITDNPWLQNGIELHWDPWSQTDGGSQLLDTTPGTPPGRADAALVIGRTFTDSTAGVHLTPVAKGGAAPDQWIDVVANLGSFPDNLPPTLALTATAAQVAPDTRVTFTATASDPNGDPLAFYWDFGDGTFGVNSNVVSKLWLDPGDYVVRCEVSDMKGGVTSAASVVRVGSPATFRISGQVIDLLGNPVAGVRVHNGEAGTNGFYGPDYRWTLTDSQGRYTLVNLAAGTYTNAAFLFGYRIAPLDFFNPITLSVADASDVNYLATPLPQISVVTNSFASEEVSNSGSFTFTRTGPTNRAQVVVFQISGSASPKTDYSLPTNLVTVTLTNISINEAFGDLNTNVLKFDAVTIPAGAYSTNFTINPTNDNVF